MVKASATDEAMCLAAFVADLLSQLDDEVAAADAAGNAPEVGVVMKSGRRYRITVAPMTAG